MKSSLTKLSLALAISCCVLFTACDSESLSGIEETIEFQEMAPYFETISTWGTKDIAALRALDTEEFTSAVEVATEGGCPGDTGYTAAPPQSLALLNSFSGELGFRSTTQMNDWYLDLGRLINDLKKEYKPNNVNDFIDEITELAYGNRATDCEMPFVKATTREAYSKSLSYNVIITGAGERTCEGAALYGFNSMIHKTYSMLLGFESCNRD